MPEFAKQFRTFLQTIPEYNQWQERFSEKMKQYRALQKSNKELIKVCGGYKIDQEAADKIKAVLK